ncbi:DinB family protein [soil metagenome]
MHPTSGFTGTQITLSEACDPAMNDYFHRLLEHVFWADSHILAVLDDSAAQRTPAVMRLFSHVLAAERVWLLRLQGEDSSVQPIWPQLSLIELKALAASNADGYAEFMGDMHDADISADVVYANSQGVPFRNRVSDILTHVAVHGSYHRGQIATAIRTSGGQPPNTDYIRFARESEQDPT